MTTKKKSGENAFFDRLNEQLDYTEMSGDHGDGGRGWWPIDDRDMAIGESREDIFNCYIDKVEFDPEGIEFTDPGGEKKTDPLLVFHYTIIDGEHAGKSFKGERFWIPLNAPPPQTDGQQTAREIEARRLTGHYETITGETGGAGVGTMVQGILAACNDEETTLAAEVKLSIRCSEGKKKTTSVTGESEGVQTVVRKYFKDHLVSLIDVDEASES